MKITTSLVALLMIKLVECAVPDTIHKAFMDILTGRKQECGKNASCSKCLSASCTSCALQSIGDLAFSSSDSFLTKTELQQFSESEIRGNAVCGVDSAKCDRLATFVTAAVNSGQLSLPKYQAARSNYCPSFSGEVQVALADLAVGRNETCRGKTKCAECQKAKCHPCVLNSIGEYAFKTNNKFLSPEQLKLFNKAEQQARLICGADTRKCAALQRATDKMIYNSEITVKKYKQVQIDQCRALQNIAKLTSFLLPALLLLNH